MYRILARGVLVSLCLFVLASGSAIGSLIVAPAANDPCSEPPGWTSTDYESSGPFSVTISVSAQANTSRPAYCFPNSVTASAQIVQGVTVTFFGGSGLAYYTPCLSGASDRLNADMSATFGPVSLPFVARHVGTCAISSSDRAYWIPFVFGVPQTQTLNLFATASAGTYSGVYGSASASFNGFIVRDQSGNVLPISPTAVPEPRAFVPVLLALGVGAFCRKRLHS